MNYASAAMRLRIGITDDDWFDFLSNQAGIDEVNFWQPSGSRAFRALSPGEPFLFKLHSPKNYIVGGGFFARYSTLPVDLAWEAFDVKNGARSYEEMRARVAKYRNLPIDERTPFIVGCIILLEPFFFTSDQWIGVPESFSRHIQQGKNYDTEEAEGRAIWKDVESRIRADGRFQAYEQDAPMWGQPSLARRRLGQGAFRIAITDTYQRRCAITQEKALPVLQAAHIRPVTKSGKHRVDNGLLLRSDVHTLFDRGYVSVTPDHRVRVSRRLKDDFDNGKHYYQLEGSQIWIPPEAHDQPNHEFLEWHADSVFLG